MMACITSREILEQTIHCGAIWICMETVWEVGSSHFDLGLLLARNITYYTAQGLARWGVTQFETLRAFNTTTRKIMVYAVTCLAMAYGLPQVLVLMGRRVVWQEIGRTAAAATLFWYFFSPHTV